MAQLQTSRVPQSRFLAFAVPDACHASESSATHQVELFVGMYAYCKLERPSSQSGTRSIHPQIKSSVIDTVGQLPLAVSLVMSPLAEFATHERQPASAFSPTQNITETHKSQIAYMSSASTDILCRRNCSSHRAAVRGQVQRAVAAGSGIHVLCCCTSPLSAALRAPYSGPPQHRGAPQHDDQVRRAAASSSSCRSTHARRRLQASRTARCIRSRSTE